MSTYSLHISYCSLYVYMCVYTYTHTHIYIYKYTVLDLINDFTAYDVNCKLHPLTKTYKLDHTSSYK